MLQLNQEGRGTKCMKQEEKEYRVGTHATSIGHQIKLTHKAFDSRYFKGNQRKGFIFFEESSGKIVKKFAKLDEISRATKGLGFKPDYNYQYSSVSEDFVSVFLSSIVTKDPDFYSVNSYLFNLFSLESRLVTGVLVDNFVIPGHLEKILASPNEDEPYNQYLVKYSDFIAEVATGSNLNDILDSLIAFFEQYGVPYERAKHFIIQQAGFDLLLGNIDRKENSGNFVMISNQNTTKPVNFDYGRMLQIIWSETTENQFRTGIFSENDIEEIVSDYVDSVIQARGGIFNNIDFEKNIDFLLENGFKPLRINLNQLTTQLSQHVDQIRLKAPQITFFSTVKAAVLLKLVQDKRVMRLVEIDEEAIQ